MNDNKSKDDKGKNKMSKAPSIKEVKGNGNKGKNTDKESGKKMKNKGEKKGK